jgi:hypothetical protein
MSAESATTGTDVMRVLVAILFCLATLPAVCQSNSQFVRQNTLSRLRTITSFIIQNRDKEVPPRGRRDRSGWVSTWARVEIPSSQSH